MSDLRFAAVVLAAGLSSRLPANKLLQPIAGKAVVRYAVEAALESRVSRVLVVTGHEAERLHAALSDMPITIVNNSLYSDGLSTSLKCGLQQVQANCDGALILLGDMPFVTGALLDRLMARFDPAAGREICVPIADCRRGNPVLWGRRFFPELMAISGDKGGKFLMDLHKEFVAELEVDDQGVLIDIDTPDDLRTQTR